MLETTEDGFIANNYQQFIHTSRYARWMPEEGRRESWRETVGRYVDFMVNHLAENYNYDVAADTRQEVYDAIYHGEVLPSMRALMTAGPALEREHVAAYNCAYVAVDDLRAFDESLYILMNGTGIGFSVESKYVDQLPIVPEDLSVSDVDIYVEDSKEGWAKAIRQQFESIFNDGLIRNLDVRDVRPAGARLKTFGGRASGPEPLVELNEFINKMVQNAAGRALTSLECHEIMCKIGQIVVVGGVRRSALISLSDLEDEEMRDAKTGAWWQEKPHLALSNNSAVHDVMPSRAVFDEEWDALRRSGSGERGFFNRQGAMRQMRATGRKPDPDVGCNPCSEILLRSQEFCNLTTIIVDPEDGLNELRRKARLATILGTWQSTLTNFGYLRDKWSENCEDERLLGVSMTGIFGHDDLNGNNGRRARRLLLSVIRETTRETNDSLADAIGVNRSAGITCVKPEGTTSQMMNVSSGLHPWFDRYFIRTIRGDKKDPLSQFLVSMGFPVEDDMMNPDSTFVFSFPIKAPDHAVVQSELGAIEHLETWLDFQQTWTDHKPSVTIYVGDDEWDEVADWVYENFEYMTGVAFFPKDDNTYPQAPYQSIDKAKYESLANRMPDVDWEMLQYFEEEDNTSGSQEMSCLAGGCEIISI